MSQGSAAARVLPEQDGGAHGSGEPRHQSPEHSAPRPEPHRRAVNRAARRNSYTVAHAGHHVRIRPAAFWLAATAFLMMTGWSVATAAYFAFHDDVLKGLVARLR